MYSIIYLIINIITLQTAAMWRHAITVQVTTSMNLDYSIIYLIISIITLHIAAKWSHGITVQVTTSMNLDYSSIYLINNIIFENEPLLAYAFNNENYKSAITYKPKAWFTSEKDTSLSREGGLFWTRFVLRSRICTPLPCSNSRCWVPFPYFVSFFTSSSPMRAFCIDNIIYTQFINNKIYKFIVALIKQRRCLNHWKMNNNAIKLIIYNMIDSKV